MKIILLVLGTMLLWASLGIAAEPNFRQATWGMSQKEVQTIEGSEGEILDGSKSNRVILGFEHSIAGFPTIIGYSFLNDELVQGVYMFSKDHVQGTIYLEDYAAIQALLEKKYGQPKSKEDQWRAETYRQMPGHRDTAIALEQLTVLAVWKTDSTRIVHRLYGENLKIRHGITYQSLAHIDQVKAATEAEHLKDF